MFRFRPVNAKFLVAWLAALILIGSVDSASAQEKKKEKTPAKSDGATIRGAVEYDPSFSETWNKGDLKIPFTEIKTKLLELVQLPEPPLPGNWAEMKPEERQDWAQEFESSEAGKKFFADNEKRMAAAKEYDVIIEKDGRFVVYDVPPAIYGLRGRVDRDVKGTMHGFEVFGQIEVRKEMDEVRLDPILLTVTPLLKAGEIAPPVEVKTHDGKNRLSLDSFKGNYLLMTFWITESPSAEFQSRIQEAFKNLKTKHKIRLLSVCVDDDATKGIKFVVDKQLREGSHGFTKGFNHPTMNNYGVRSIPSFWLISPDGKIAMSQFEFAVAFRTKNDLSEIVSDRIEGKDTPTPAPADALTPAKPKQ